jgi:hypothetical protein
MRLYVNNYSKSIAVVQAMFSLYLTAIKETHRVISFTFSQFLPAFFVSENIVLLLLTETLILLLKGTQA